MLHINNIHPTHGSIIITGVLLYVQADYGIDNSLASLLQIIFVVGFMLTSPLFGYFGDRYNRKWLMFGGILLWIIVTLAGSFVPSNVSCPSDSSHAYGWSTW